MRVIYEVINRERGGVVLESRSTTLPLKFYLNYRDPNDEYRKMFDLHSLAFQRIFHGQLGIFSFNIFDKQLFMQSPIKVCCQLTIHNLCELNSLFGERVKSQHKISEKVFKAMTINFIRIKTMCRGKRSETIKVYELYTSSVQRCILRCEYNDDTGDNTLTSNDLISYDTAWHTFKNIERSYQHSEHYCRECFIHFNYPDMEIHSKLYGKLMRGYFRLPHIRDHKNEMVKMFHVQLKQNLVESREID